jgi:hypothetical protein
VLQNIGYLTASDDPSGGEDAMRERMEDARRVGNRRQLAELQVDAAWTRVWGLRFDEARAELAAVDVESLSDGARRELQNQESIIASLTGDPGALRRMLDERGARGHGDTQVAAADASTEAAAGHLVGDERRAFEIAAAMPIGPMRVDLIHGVMAALRLRDPELLARVAREAATSPYRGRSITAIRRAAEGALAALDGRRSEAIDHWTQVAELTDQVWPAWHRYVVRAEAASYLGTDEEPGRSWGREAFEAFRDTGATTGLVMFADWLVTDDDLAAGETGAAAG